MQRRAVSRNRSVDRQNPIRESHQHLIIQPLALQCTRYPVAPLVAHHTDLQLEDRDHGQKLSLWIR